MPQRDESIAELISTVAHPLVLLAVLFGTAAAMRFSSRGAAAIIVAFAAIALLPAVLFLRGRVRSGHWKDTDASRPTERKELLRASLLIAGATGLLLLATPRLRTLAYGAVASMIIFALAAFANRWLRVSLHMAFATFVAIGLSAFVRPEAAVALVLLPLVVAWARLKLRRHTVTEIVLGAILGGLAGLWLRMM